MSGTCVLALLPQSEQGAEGFSGERSMQLRRGVGDEVGSRDGNASAHEVPVGDEDMAGTLRWTDDRHDGEASAEQRMSGIGYLDLLKNLVRWVLKGGIVLLSRFLPLTTPYLRVSWRAKSRMHKSSA